MPPLPRLRVRVRQPDSARRGAQSAQRGHRKLRPEVAQPKSPPVGGCLRGVLHLLNLPVCEKAVQPFLSSISPHISIDSTLDGVCKLFIQGFERIFSCFRVNFRMFRYVCSHGHQVTSVRRVHRPKTRLAHWEIATAGKYCTQPIKLRSWPLSVGACIARSASTRFSVCL